MQKGDGEWLKEQHRKRDQMELSNAWLELLGLSPSESCASASSESSQWAIPMLESDPWSKLGEADNIECVDLQQVRLPLSEWEVEQMLQLVQEQVAQDQCDSKGPKN